MRKRLSMFLVPSLIGILLFMIPIPYGPKGFFDPEGSTTVIVKVIADGIKNFLGYSNVAVLCLFILSTSAILAIIGLKKPKFLTENPILNECFVCSPVWVIIRSLGCIFVWLTWLFNEDFRGLAHSSRITDAIAGADQGALAYDLIIGLIFVFLIASYLLPLLTDFGLLEYVGAVMTKFMRPLFHVPGRAAVDGITSWIGDGTLGVMLTCNQYSQ